MTDAVRVVGLPRLRKTMRQAGVDMADMKAANAKAAATIAAASRARAPSRTGRLAGSVRGNKAVGRAVVMAGGARLPYGGPIHWGWPARGIGAQPFISDAARATEPSWLPAYLDDLNQILGQVKGA